jgi:hypothetical protein
LLVSWACLGACLAHLQHKIQVSTPGCKVVERNPSGGGGTPPLLVVPRTALRRGRCGEHGTVREDRPVPGRVRRDLRVGDTHRARVPGRGGQLDLPADTPEPDRVGHRRPCSPGRRRRPPRLDVRNLDRVTRVTIADAVPSGSLTTGHIWAALRLARSTTHTALLYGTSCVHWTQR